MSRIASTALGALVVLGSVALGALLVLGLTAGAADPEPGEICVPVAEFGIEVCGPEPTTSSSTSSTTTTTTTTAPPTAGRLGVIGCSNTKQAVDGYLQASTEDRLVNTAQGKASISRWADPGSQAWVNYDRHRPYSGVWLQLCERADNGNPDQGLIRAEVDAVLDLIWERDPGIPVYMSPLNFYGPTNDPECRVTDGNFIPDQGAGLADDYSDSDPLIHRGPDLGPLTSAMTSDNCHANTTGIALLGAQLVEWFD